jgi:hypothetical protein
MKTNTLSLILIPLLTCFASLRPAEAVDPPPGGGEPGVNTAEDLNAPFNPASGVHNTAVGDGALENNQGNNNTAAGYAALRRNIFGNQNTATGALALNNNDLGRENTANGFQALLINTTGSRNTATGERALERNSTGNNNTATGVSALFRNTGDNNTAGGFEALKNNSTGNNNTATGHTALHNNTTGIQNTATGTNALESNTTGDNNTSIGFGTLTSNTTGRNNTAIGFRAGANSTTGENNIYIGEKMFGVPGESNHTYVRNVNITSVSGGGADTVTVDLGTGLIGHLSSSRRYKQNIKPMDNTSEALYRLRPVTFRDKKEIDRTQSPVFGLVAEEVAQVNPALVAHDGNGQPESVHYEMVNAMLLNEFLKEHRKMEQQDATIARQQKQIDALTAGLQKVSAQLEVSKPAPQTVLNNQ